jgi:hypothetical protein
MDTNHKQLQIILFFFGPATGNGGFQLNHVTELIHVVRESYQDEQELYFAFWPTIVLFGCDW